MNVAEKRPLGVYRVIGRRPYRGHDPGTIFEAVIQPGAERRAVDRGDIELLDRVTPELPERFELPPGWIRVPHAVNRGAERRLSHSRR